MRCRGRPQDTVQIVVFVGTDHFKKQFSQLFVWNSYFAVDQHQAQFEELVRLIAGAQAQAGAELIETNHFLCLSTKNTVSRGKHGKEKMAKRRVRDFFLPLQWPKGTKKNNKSCSRAEGFVLSCSLPPSPVPSGQKTNNESCRRASVDRVPLPSLQSFWSQILLFVHPQRKQILPPIHYPIGNMEQFRLLVLTAGLCFLAPSVHPFLPPRSRASSFWRRIILFVQSQRIPILPPIHYSIGNMDQF